MVCSLYANAVFIFYSGVFLEWECSYLYSLVCFWCSHTVVLTFCSGIFFVRWCGLFLHCAPLCFSYANAVFLFCSDMFLECWCSCFYIVYWYVSCMLMQLVLTFYYGMFLVCQCSFCILFWCVSRMLIQSCFFILFWYVSRMPMQLFLRFILICF